MIRRYCRIFHYLLKEIRKSKGSSFSDVEVTNILNDEIYNQVFCYNTDSMYRILHLKAERSGAYWTRLEELYTFIIDYRWK